MEALTAAAQLLNRQDHGGVIGYASDGGTWSPVYCKPGRRVFNMGDEVFGYFASDPNRIGDPSATCWCTEETLCWSIQRYTDLADLAPRIGRGCSTPAYNGKVYVTTPAKETLETGTSSEASYQASLGTQVSGSDDATADLNDQPDGAGDEGASGLTKGEIAGIVVGAVGTVATVCGVWSQKRRSRQS